MRFSLYIITYVCGPVRVSARMVFPEFESGAGRKPMKNMAQGGNRTRRIIGTGGTLGAGRQYKYLVRTPAPRGGS